MNLHGLRQSPHVIRGPVAFCCALLLGLASGCGRPEAADAPGQLPAAQHDAQLVPARLRAEVGPAPPEVDLQPTTPGVPLARIADGVLITDDAAPPEGWSHLVLLAVPRLAQGDLKVVTANVRRYASMFRLAILANVVEHSLVGHYLKQVAVGMVFTEDGHSLVISSAGHQSVGVELDFVSRRVLAANEERLDDVIVVARTPTMCLFDAGSTMLIDGRHRRMLMRHAVLVDPASGQLDTVVWLVDPRGGNRPLADGAAQRLPNSYREDRILNVLGSKFLFGVPTPDAFALVQVPPGEPLEMSESLREMSGLIDLPLASVVSLEESLRAALRTVEK